MNITCHSDIGKIKSIFVKDVEDAFINEAHIALNWETLNYLGKPDLATAREEYKYFLSILKKEGIEILNFPKDASVNMDSIYCRDAAVASDGGMILCNMGKAARKMEPAAQQKAFAANGISILGSITAPGTLEGGDVAWLDTKTLAVGHTYRTNPEGIRQLTGFLLPLEVEVIIVPLPHYQGPGDVFHLMSVFSPVDTNLAVVYSPLMPIVFRNLLLDRGYQLVEVPAEEFESMGCNVLAIAPRQCIMVSGNPKTRSALEATGCKVTEYKGDEISITGGGGPTCLTRPLNRYV
jgi:N-dimethylarginine dimethylaminohydrolase